MVSLIVLTQSQCSSNTSPISNTSCGHDAYWSVRKLSIQHISNFRYQAHNAGSLTKLVASSIYTLSHEHIRTVLDCLSCCSNITNLDKHNRRITQSLEARDNLAMRPKVSIWSKQPYCRRTILDYKWQSRLLKVAQGAMTCYEASSDTEWPIRRLIGFEKFPGFIKVANKSIDVLRVWFNVGQRGEESCC